MSLKLSKSIKTALVITLAAFGVLSILLDVSTHRHPITRFLTWNDDPKETFQNEEDIGGWRWSEKNSTTILHGIFSMSTEQEKERRKLIRDTYLSLQDERICSLNDYMKKVDETGTVDSKCQITYAFVIAAGRDDRPTEHDDEQPLFLDVKEVKGADSGETDIMYLNIQENMEGGSLQGVPLIFHVSFHSIDD